MTALMAIVVILYAGAADELYEIKGSNLWHGIFTVPHKCYSATKEVKTELRLIAEYISQ